MMSDPSQRIADLSPDKRRLLEMMLKEESRQPDSFPLSFAQQRLWFLDQLEPGSPIYNIPAAVRLKGWLKTAALEEGFNEIIRRHEALRTTFAAIDGKPVQLIAPALTLSLPVMDLSASDPSEREAEVLRLAGEEARRPFDLASGPLVRATLLRLCEQEHVLLLTMHHIVSDGWSAGILIKEMGVVYEACARGLPPALPEMSIQYGDFVVWQRDWLRGEVLEQQLAYWKRQLQGRLPVLELPTDHPRPAVETFRGRRLSFQLTRDHTGALKKLSRDEGVTLFMTLLAAFEVLLHRYTGQTDILVGTPVAGRTRSETESLIGFFANTLVLRTDLSGNPTFREFLSQVRDVTLESFNYQDLPFEKLVEEIHPERDLSHNPLFQVMFVWQNAPLPPLKLTGLSMDMFEVDSNTSKFDLTLLMQEEEGTLSGLIEYNTDLFEAATITRMAGHFQTLLEAVAARPATSLLSLPFLTPVEAQQQLDLWNRTQAKYPQDQCIHQLCEAQAAQHPDEVAVIFEGRALTYSELNRRANQLAQRLRKLGVKPEVLVGICVEPSLEMVVGLLAMVKAGGACVALDPTYPEERLAFMIEDARMPVLLTQEHLAASLPVNSATTRVYLDAEWKEFADESGENPISGVSSENLLYAIYTSGSTGLPKGIGVPHRAFLNLLQWQSNHSTLARKARTVQFAAFGFCVSFQEIFTAWSSGATLLLVKDETRRNMEALVEFLTEQAVERLHLPFAALKQLVETTTNGKTLPASLRELITAGEQLQITRSVSALFEHLPNCSLHNQYGASETHVVSSFRLSNSPANWPAIPPVGRPIANTQIYLLNADLQPVPIGVSGELYVSGLCLARGYLNDPALTALKFIPNPFSRRPGERLYRTGDVARYLTDGNIEYLGRADLQVKVRGFRIEPGEIETVLARHPNVTDAAVVAQGDKNGDTRLTAYLVMGREEPCTIKEVRDFLKKKLPDYMVPTNFVTMDALPLNVNGKLDREALPLPAPARPGLDRAYVPPHTYVAETVAQIWAEVLKLDRVGLADNFFDLGGHSLLATQVISRVRDLFRRAIPLRTLFERPTLAEFSESIGAAITGDQDLQGPPILAAGRVGSMPLSFAQQRLWFLDRLMPGSPIINLPALIYLRGSLDADVLGRVLNEIIRRHEVLRTSFTTIDGRPAQVIAPTLRLRLQAVDIEGFSASEYDQERIHRLARAEAQAPFDLAHGPLLRAKLLRLGHQEHVLLLTMHHIVCDGWSMGVLVREMAALYEAYAKGGSSPLAELPLQYADFARWQREWLSGSVLETQLSYWKQMLAGNPPVIALPADRPRVADQSLQAAVETFEVSRSLSEALKALSRREGVTLFMTLLAAFQTLLYWHTGEEDILLATPVAGRNQLGTEKLIGCFINTLALRTSVAGDLSFRELLARVREVALGAYAHQDLPFEKLVEELHPERDANSSPLFRLMFVLQNTAQEEVEIPDLLFRPAPADNGLMQFDLILSMTEEGGVLVGAVGYQRELFNRPTITRFISHLKTLLQSIVADPDERLANLHILTEGERGGMDTADFPDAGMSHMDFENLILEISEAADKR